MQVHRTRLSDDAQGEQIGRERRGPDGGTWPSGAAHPVLPRGVDDADPARQREAYARKRHWRVAVSLGTTMPVALVYDYVEIRVAELHVYHDIYARLGDPWGHIMQTLAAHGYPVDSLEQAAIQKRLKVDATLAEQLLYIAVAQREALGEPDPMADDRAGETVVFVAFGVGG